MHDFEIVAVTSSAESTRAAMTVLSELPGDFPAPVLYRQHLSPDFADFLLEVLEARSALPVRWAAAGDRIAPGVVHVCPADCEMSVAADRTLAVGGAAPNGGATDDRLLESVAARFGAAAVVVSLGDDAARGRGLDAVRACAGTVLAPSGGVATHAIAPILVSLLRAEGPLPVLPSPPAPPCVLGRDLVTRAAIDRLLHEASSSHGTDMGNVQVLDPRTNVLTIAAQRGFSCGFLHHFRTVSIGDGSACGRASTGEVVHVEDVETCASLEPHREVLAAARVRAVRSVPLTTPSGIVGVVSVHFRTPRRGPPEASPALGYRMRRVAEHIGSLLAG